MRELRSLGFRARSISVGMHRRSPHLFLRLSNELLTRVDDCATSTDSSSNWLQISKEITVLPQITAQK